MDCKFVEIIITNYQILKILDRAYLIHLGIITKVMMLMLFISPKYFYT